MSWSVNFFGDSSKVAEALEAESDKLHGLSKKEYDSVKRHLIGLVQTNFRPTESGPRLVRLSASGSGVWQDEWKRTEGTLSISLEPHHGTVLI